MLPCYILYLILPDFLFLSASLIFTIHPLLSLCSPPPPIPPSHPLPLSLSLSSRSLPFFAQDRSALITLMALMIQLNGALSPQCLSKAFLCSMLTQQHSTVTADSALSVSALTVTSRYYRTGHGEICLCFIYLSRILRV